MNDPQPNPDPELDTLFALARKNRPDTSRAEYAFETRLLGRIRERRQHDAGSIWAKVSWRMVPFFAAFVIALGIWRAEVVSDANEVANISSINQPEADDLLDSLN